MGHMGSVQPGSAIRPVVGVSPLDGHDRPRRRPSTTRGSGAEGLRVTPASRPKPHRPRTRVWPRLSADSVWCRNASDALSRTSARRTSPAWLDRTSRSRSGV